MTSNFDFLQNRFPQIFEHATHAESLVYSAPRASCFYSRFTLEQAIYWLYENEPYLQLPFTDPKDNNLAALIHEQTFKDNLNPPSLWQKVRIIHKLGNFAVHDSTTIRNNDAQTALKELHHFLYWLCRYYAADGRELGDRNFQTNLIPQPKTTTNQDLTQAQLEQLETQLSQAKEMQRIAELKQQQTEQELETLKAEISALKRQNQTVPDTHDFNEAETRSHLIDLLLKEAGWNINQPGWKEYEVSGMPNQTGKGFVDYVLWGDDGKPLAVIEAKRCKKNPKNGKRQAELYANCLENQYNQRPIIFYSNGYQHWIWDDRNYPPRQIEGFLKKDELERLIFRRTSRKALHLIQLNSAIVERSYQTEAIRQITQSFEEKKSRKALLVMATGSGKTRTAIALIDLLIRANWVKRVLFLADRKVLVEQALGAFKTHLPTATAIDLTENKDVEAANVIVSTYPTICNFINRYNSQGRILGSGHFDLIIVDEAHRSIYQKYASLFDYFDGLLVGLTATPRDEVHRDTYRLFELETGVPTFAYQLEDAIKDKWLVPAKGVEVPFKFLTKGIKYSDLSPEEQEEYEQKFRNEETGQIPKEVNAAALNQWLFNINTVDRALQLLMERGLKVAGGDRLGKTIIFARNKKHAEFIVERFDINYPHYQGKFAQAIHSEISYAKTLINDFSEVEKEPTIAISVDMLDTGVDVPEVVNLVFFKPVYSRVKFNQMIGRGTRLCKNLFGIDEDKTEFLVFDLCGNFEFFQRQIPPTNQKLPESLTSRLVKTRLELAQLLNKPENQNSETQEIRQNLLNQLHQHVATMERENFLVRRHLPKVEEFSQRERWENLRPEDREIISESLASLPNQLPTGDRLAKEFDLLCLKLQLSLLKHTNDFIRLRDQIRDLLTLLEQKRDIPAVKAELSLIAEVQNENWWIDVTPWMIEYLRFQLRDLVKFIDRQEQRIVYTNFTDSLGEISEVEVPQQQTGFSPYQYRRKVEAYIRANENHVAIAKLKRNIPLTESDLQSLETMLFNSAEIESREQFEQVYGKNLSLKLFIRKLVGLDRSAAKQAFAEYLKNVNFSAQQIRFIENIIDYLTQNGVMNPEQLYESPFTEVHPDGLDGVFSDRQADRILEIVRSINHTAEAKFATA